MDNVEKKYVLVGRMKECNHWLHLSESLRWLRESDIHDLFVSTLKMRKEFLFADDEIKDALIKSLKDLSPSNSDVTRNEVNDVCSSAVRNLIKQIRENDAVHNYDSQCLINDILTKLEGLIGLLEGNLKIKDNE